MPENKNEGEEVCIKAKNKDNHEKDIYVKFNISKNKIEGKTCPIIAAFFIEIKNKEVIIEEKDDNNQIKPESITDYCKYFYICNEFRKDNKDESISYLLKKIIENTKSKIKTDSKVFFTYTTINLNDDRKLYVHSFHDYNNSTMLSFFSYESCCNNYKKLFPYYSFLRKISKKIGSLKEYESLEKDNKQSVINIPLEGEVKLFNANKNAFNDPDKDSFKKLQNNLAYFSFSLEDIEF